jgi:histidinol-phosphate/aromatic aminotransferase/cobyric acid decarboxylase-like protein
VKGGDCLRSGDAAGITPVINPNNPTGAVYPSKTLEDIAELARWRCRRCWTTAMRC